MRHRNEKVLLDFLATQGSRYIQESYYWLKREYPESAEALASELRTLYRKARENEKTKAER